MPDYNNVYTGKDAIEVIPWVLPRVRLMTAGDAPAAKGSFLEFSLDPNDMDVPPMVRAIPFGFVTAQFMELDLSSDDEIAKFCARWGVVASPYAGGIDRACERLLDRDAQDRMLRKVGERYGGLPRDPDPELLERLGRDVWYLALEDASVDEAYREYLGGSCWLNIFKRETSSLGTEALNARMLAREAVGGRTYVYVDEVRETLALMRVAVLYHGFLELAHGDDVKAIGGAVRFDDNAERSTGRRPFEEALSHFISTGFLHSHAESEAWKDARNFVLQDFAGRINDNTMLFADLCLRAAPTPLVAHAGFRRGGLNKATSKKGLGREGVGSLLNAMAAQLYAYLNDGNPWKRCKVCGRPFKYEQQEMSPVTDEAEANSIYSRRHRASKTEFCSKRHEKLEYTKRNEEYRARLLQ